MVRSLTEVIVSDALVRFLADATIKATLLLLVSWLLVVTSRRSSAALRHRIWALALCGLIALPVVSWLVPGWSLPVFPAPVQPADESQPWPTAPIVAQPVDVPHVLASPPDDRGDIGVRALPRVSEVPTHGVVVAPLARSVPAVAIDQPTISPARTPRGWTLAGGLLMLWGVGFLVALLPTVLGVFANEWNRWQARRVVGEEWWALLDALRQRFSIRRAVELRQSEASPIPLTWGVVRPVILIPDDAQGWPESTRRSVLLHEVAHIQRLDAGFQLAGRLAAALYWFHPLAWYALHRLRVEGEHACDDCVVLAGERPSDYARQLLALARSMRMPRFAMAVAMARGNTLERRMTAMFDDTRSHAPLGRRAGRLIGIVAVLGALGLATVHPGPSAAAPRQPAGAVESTAGITSQPEANKSGQVVRDGLPDPAPKDNGRITGRVVGDAEGKPAEGAEVVLVLVPPKGQDPDIGKFPRRRTVTDARGTFSFEGLVPGRYHVWANLGKLTSRLGAGRGEVVLLPDSGEVPKPVELRLVAGVAVTVRAKDKATGRPIPNATVHFDGNHFRNDATTDRDGMVRIQPLMARQWPFEVWADGYAKVSRWVNLENGVDGEEEFRLGPGGDLEGVIRDPAGNPLAGARISALADGVQVQFAYVETGADGRYRHAHLPLGSELRLLVSRDDFLREEVTTHLTSMKETLDLTMQPRPNGGSIAGVVLDPNGKPIAGAQLRNVGMSSDLVRETKSGPDGRFRLDDLFENHIGKEVIVRGKGFAPKHRRVDPGPPNQPAEVTIALEPGHRIKGRVTDEKGRPLGGVRVYYAGANHGYEAGGQAKTDDQGLFTLDSLPADCPFAFYKGGYSEIEDRKLTLDTDDVVTVVMVPAGAIVGRVLDARTGQPIRSFKVQINFSPKRRPEEPSTVLLTRLINPGQMFQSNEGHFKVEELVLDMPLQVTVSAEGYERHVTERVVVARPDEGRVEGFRLDPVDPASLRTYRGRLVDAKGNPVTGAELRLFAARHRDPDQRRMFPFNWSMIQDGQLAQQSNVTRFLEAVTDAQGRFEFTRIPRGDEVELAWWGKGIAHGRSDYLERLEEKALIEIIISTPARIIVTIDRKSFTGAGRIQVIHASDFSGTIDRELKPGQTEFAFDDLAPGEYQVNLTSPFERVPGIPSGLTLRILASVQVTVAPSETKRVGFNK
jgi:beta-lactamase regulating signal transducer with metallopeptidase domain